MILFDRWIYLDCASQMGLILLPWNKAKSAPVHRFGNVYDFTRVVGYVGPGIVGRSYQETHHDVVTAVLKADPGDLVGVGDQETVVDGRPLGLRGGGYIVERPDVYDILCDPGRHGRRSVRRSNGPARLNEGEGRRNTEATRETQKAMRVDHF